jgi:hypothetical protein
VFAPWVVPLLALALVPQATLLTPTAAVALAAPCGSEPSVLPPHTNCACACDVPRHSISVIVSAMAAGETKHNRTQYISAATLAKKLWDRRSTPATATECCALKVQLSRLKFSRLWRIRHVAFRQFFHEFI